MNRCKLLAGFADLQLPYHEPHETGNGLLDHVEISIDVGYVSNLTSHFEIKVIMAGYTVYSYARNYMWRRVPERWMLCIGGGSIATLCRWNTLVPSVHGAPLT